LERRLNEAVDAIKRLQDDARRIDPDGGFDVEVRERVRGHLKGLQTDAFQKLRGAFDKQEAFDQELHVRVDLLGLLDNHWGLIRRDLISAAMGSGLWDHRRGSPSTILLAALGDAQLVVLYALCDFSAYWFQFGLGNFLKTVREWLLISPKLKIVDQALTLIREGLLDCQRPRPKYSSRAVVLIFKEASAVDSAFAMLVKRNVGLMGQVKQALAKQAKEAAELKCRLSVLETEAPCFAGLQQWRWSR